MQGTQHAGEMLFASRPTALVIPKVTGTISAVSSFLIINVIFRSEKKLSTIYHRIMFVMSCGDIMASISRALTTLPMPKQNICPGQDYNWDAVRLGTVGTCQAQGFFLRFGYLIMYSCNLILFIYYACVIAFNMKDVTIRKRVEPVLHCFAFLFSLVNAAIPLFHQQYHANGPWPSCNYTGRISCETSDTSVPTNYLFLVYAAVLLIAMIICFGLIIRKVWLIDRIMRVVFLSIKRRSQLHDNDDVDGRDNNEGSASENAKNIRRVKESHQVTKVVVVQAMAYFIVFILCLIFPIINIASGYDLVWAQYLQLTFTLLQGFFNFLIFIGHKVYNHKRIYRDNTYCDILKKLFCGSEFQDDPIELTGISLVRRDDRRNMALNFVDENGIAENINIEMKEHSHSEGVDAMVDEDSDANLSGSLGIYISRSALSVIRGNHNTSNNADTSEIDDSKNMSGLSATRTESRDIMSDSVGMGLSLDQSNNDHVGIIARQSNTAESFIDDAMTDNDQSFNLSGFDVSECGTESLAFAEKNCFQLA